MTITVNSAALSNGQPSAPFRVVEVDVDLDASYPTGGYDITAQLEGGTVVASQLKPDWNGSALRHIKIAATGFVQAFVDDNGTQGAEETAAVDVSGHTGVVLWCLVQ